MSPSWINKKHTVITSCCSHHYTPLLQSLLRAKRSNPKLNQVLATPSFNRTITEPQNMNTATLRKPRKPKYQAFYIAALAGLLTLAFINPATAADFPGSLKGATITDTQTTNQPPVAAFTYAVSGESVTFDASGSSDPDGSILKYKWSFADGSLAEGMTVTKTLPEETRFNVTLTVEDSSNGVALKQQTVAAVVEGIHDDFSTDTAANYTVVIGKALNVSEGVLRTSPWSTTVAYHTTNLGSNDHTAEAEVVYNQELGGSGLLVRFDPTQQTGYLVWFQSGRITINKFENGTSKYLALHDGSYANGHYKLKVGVKGQIITVSVNGTVVLTKTDTSIATGPYVGVRLRAGADSTPITIDNLSGNLHL